jgi:hypothetical protein
MTPKLQYSFLVASLIASVIYFFALITPSLDWYWWLGFAMVALTAAVVLAGVGSYERTTRPGPRYPAAPAFDYKAAIQVRDKTRRGPDATDLRRVA